VDDTDDPPDMDDSARGEYLPDMEAPPTGVVPGPAELSCLGLGLVAQRVLALLLDGRERHGSAVARELGCTEMAASRGLRELLEAGFVHIDATMRPAPVSLRPVRPLVEEIAGFLRRESAQRLGDLARLAARVDGLGRAEPRGPHWTSPGGLRGADAELRALTAERSFACIVGPGCTDPPAMIANAPRRPTCRYLLSRDAVVTRYAVRRAEVRQHPDQLPDVVLVDGQRMAVSVVIRGWGARGWTTDARQVALGLRLFEDLWKEGGSVSRWVAHPFDEP
jgi:hypothetical protein